MSSQNRTSRLTSLDIRGRKGGEPLVALTAYTAPMAKIVDEVADVALVGDSLGMVVYGLDSTVPVTLEMMSLHGQAVTRATARSLVVIDMPFGSYEEGREQAFRNAARLLKAVNTLGGYKAQGRSKAEWPALIADAEAIADAGAFSVVVEAVAEPLAAEITKKIAIPTIGIGASATCDGQVLVLDDMLGLTGRVPKFVKAYGDLAGHVREAVRTYAAEVRSRQFPGGAHVYSLKAE
jgi:3-methyl-2-oxobutanoate hydroxymethyltransferase